MKTLGLIGGISYHSTAVYYNLINQQMNQKLGGNQAAKIMLYSVNYADFKSLQSKNDWNGIESMLSRIAITLEKAGADCILLCCNTAHLIAEELTPKINIPFLHIANETAKEIARTKYNKVGLIGTKFIIENPFFMDALSKVGIETIIPNTKEQSIIHHIILDEMSKGVLSNRSKELLLLTIQNLKEAGAQAIVFGCTEIGIFITPSDCDLKIFDTTKIHVSAAVDFATQIQ